ncbi:MAG: hypothetical protein CMF22_10375 [Idiomarinaceae bacterium]|nr:hypothetical protein [Idiomarinaceae bacterium]MBG23846.1 hypothetical protein [Idiomarinaceae bacterium]|tara:strand:+ start:22043 stop:22441 length:399 start_codon:yes stop_codon:yes gene_type:complete
MSLQKELIDRGYKKHVSDMYRVLEMTDTLYQKCIRDHLGNKKYYINVWYYPADRSTGLDLPEGIEIRAQLHDQDDEHYMNVNPMTRDIDQAEETIEEVWEKLDMGYYERYIYEKGFGPDDPKQEGETQQGEG